MHLHSPVFSCYCCHFFLVFFLNMHVIMLIVVKNGQLWWVNAFSGSLPLCCYRCYYFMLCYLLGKWSSLSLSLSLSSVPYASGVNVFCIHCVYTARPPYQIGASRQTMVSTTCLFVAAVALLMSITLNCGHWTIRVMWRLRVRGHHKLTHGFYERPLSKTVI